MKLIKLTYRPFLYGFSISLLLVVFMSNCVLAQLEDSGPSAEVQEEIDFAQGLSDLGLTEYSERILNIIKGTNPEVDAIIASKRIINLGSLGKFDEAKAIIAKQADPESQQAWAMKLSLADTYYAWGKYADAEAIYTGFFKKYESAPPAGLKSFFLKSAYKFSQMLLLMGKNKEAIAAYKNVLKVVPKDDFKQKDIRRRILSETAELMIKVAEDKKTSEADRKKYFKQVEDYCTEILWVQDIWFGKAIVLKAHILMIKGDIEGAMKLIDDYKKNLKAIDDSLDAASKEENVDYMKMSPMAECRFMLGKMMLDEAEKQLSAGNRDKAKLLLAGKKDEHSKKTVIQGAIHHFINVFIRYPSSPWAPEAGKLGDKVENILIDEFGAKIKKHITPEQLAAVESAQFLNARSLYNQHQYKQAIDAYVAVLNLFPEGETPVKALGELAACYLEVKTESNEVDEWYVDMVLHYLADRFSQNEKLQSLAGDQLLRLADMYTERKMPERANDIYNVYFASFTHHPRAASMLFVFAEKSYKAKNYEEALSYFIQITDNFKDSPLFFDALDRMALCYHGMNNTVAEIKALDLMCKNLEKKPKPGHRLIAGKFRLAMAYRSLGDKYIPSAFNRYNELIKLLTGPGKDSFHKTAEEDKANRGVLEGSLFYKALCYVQLKTSNKTTAKKYKLQAVKSFEALVEQFPKSQFAPPALNQIGVIWTVLEDPAKARAALDKLRKDYPDSKEAENALFMLGKSLLEMGRRQAAVKIFKEMFSGNGQYTERQILTAGNELLTSKEYEIAIEAFDRVLSKTKERAWVEPAMLGKGKALLETKKYIDSAKILDDMFKKFPNSGYTIEAALAMSEAYSEVAKVEKDGDKRFDFFNDAIKALKIVRKYGASDSGIKAESDLGVARIQLNKAHAETTFGTPDKALEYEGNAIAAYQTLIMFSKQSDPKVRPYIETAYFEVIPMLIKTERYQDAVDDCKGYVEHFPKGKYLVQIRSMQRKAEISQSTSEAAAPDAVEPEGESVAK